MTLKVLGSSSEGNCYLLENEKEALLIECGVPFDKIKIALRFNLSKVRGCIISHEHLDHCKSAMELLKLGINIYASAGTLRGIGEALRIDNLASHHRAYEVHTDTIFSIGNFRIRPFTVKHDAYEPYGFLINHPQTGTILFVTDTYYVPKRFSGLNNILVEANYCQTILDKRMKEGESPEFLRNRIFKSHMSLATCKDLLAANDLSKVNNIVLIHLSDGNSHAVRFREEVTALTGKLVHIAAPGLTIPFSREQI